MLPWGLSGSLQAGKLWPRSSADGRSQGLFQEASGPGAFGKQPPIPTVVPGDPTCSPAVRI